MSSSDVCGRLRWKVASKSPLVEISVTLAYQSLRGFLRNFCSDTPRRRSQVHFTSLAVNGLPSCHLTPSRSLKVSCVLSAFHVQLVASSGTMVDVLFCSLCWSNSTRLLKTPIIGTLVEKVASSWIDMPPGVSR